jgi:hypothetical protein
MFDFINGILERIGQFISDIVLVIIIVLAVVLLCLVGHRNANNPYRDHSQEIRKQQIEADRDAQYKAALQRLYDEYRR